MWWLHAARRLGSLLIPGLLLAGPGSSKHAEAQTSGADNPVSLAALPAGRVSADSSPEKSVGQRRPGTARQEGTARARLGYQRAATLAQGSPRRIQSRAFRALGEDDPTGLLSLLSDEPPVSDRRVRAALRASVLAAVGSLRRPEAVPVVLTALREDGDPRVSRAAAVALGRIGTDLAVEELTTLAERPDPDRAVALAGLGECRRLGAAEALAALLRERPPAAEAARLVDALGGVGNAWAWETPSQAATGEEAATRHLAARALLEAFVGYDEETVRRGATKALLLVDLAPVRGWVEDAKAVASPGLARALDRLGDKLGRSPLRAQPAGRDP